MMGKMSRLIYKKKIKKLRKKKIKVKFELHDNYLDQLNKGIKSKNYYTDKNNVPRNVSYNLFGTVSTSCLRTCQPLKKTNRFKYHNFFFHFIL